MTHEHTDPAPAARPAVGGVMVVVPAYNEADRVGAVVAALVHASYAVIVVDDGSSDDTGRAAEAAGAFVLRHLVNRGQGAALQTGIEFALRRGAEIVVTFDADGQHDVADVAALTEPIHRRECDVVLGSRFLGRADNIPWSRRVVLKLGIWFTRRTSGLPITDTHNGLRALSARAARRIELTLDRMAHASELLEQIKRSGAAWREVAVRVRYSEASLAKGQSSWNALPIAARVLWKRLRP